MGNTPFNHKSRVAVEHTVNKKIAQSAEEADDAKALKMILDRYSFPPKPTKHDEGKSQSRSSSTIMKATYRFKRMLSKEDLKVTPLISDVHS